MRTGDGLGVAVATVAGLGVGAMAWAVAEAGMYTLRHATVPILPTGSEPIRLLHLTDMHLVPKQRRKRDWVRSLADLRPDVVVDTGDNMAHPHALPAVLDALEPLLAVPGVFVMGSNDYYAPAPKNPSRYLLRDPRTKGIGDTRALPAAELGAAFRAAGWRDLTNRRDSLEVKGVRFALAGVDDPHLDRDRFPPDQRVRTRVGAGLDREVKGSDVGGSGAPPAVRLGVTHAPYRRVLDAMWADGADLIIAGHTHGGQLCLPFVGALVTNCDLDRGRAKGLHGWPGPRPDRPGGAGSAWLHVSAGIGTSPYAPVRFACRPEATLLELVPR